LRHFVHKFHKPLVIIVIRRNHEAAGEQQDAGGQDDDEAVEGLDWVSTNMVISKSVLSY